MEENKQKQYLLEGQRAKNDKTRVTLRGFAGFKGRRSRTNPQGWERRLDEVCVGAEKRRLGLQLVDDEPLV